MSGFITTKEQLRAEAAFRGTVIENDMDLKMLQTTLLAEQASKLEEIKEEMQRAKTKLAEQIKREYSADGVVLDRTPNRGLKLGSYRYRSKRK